MIMRCVGLALLTSACTSGTPKREAAAWWLSRRDRGRRLCNRSSIRPLRLRQNRQLEPRQRDLVGMSASWAMIDEVTAPQVVVELIPVKGWHIY